MEGPADTFACPSCGKENPAGSRFCNECGTPLDGEAPSRGAPPGEEAPAHGAPPGGVPRAPDASAPGAPPQEAPELPEHLARKAATAAPKLAGERKQVTVLFADVTGSMDLAERTDPERWQEIMSGFFKALSDSVHRFEGTVDKFTGDGIMALFGAPIAHEDHAQRACYSALEMQREVGEYANEVRRRDGISLTTRIGINSGEVVVGSIGDAGDMEYTAVGHTVGLAQRMESLAEPGKAYLTEDSERLVAGFLELTDLGEFEVKGSSEPLRIFELTGLGAARGRLDVSRQRGFSRFVGRGDEMAALQEAVERATAGEGAVIAIVGEAGVGKSRLCHELAESCRTRTLEVYEAQCQAHGRSLPLLPVLQIMRAYFGIEADDSERDAREKIAGRLLLLDPGFADDLALVFDFLGVPDPQRPAPQLNPEARQRRLIAIVGRLVTTSGRQDVAVNIVEDLHWIDPASETFLEGLVGVVPGTPTVVIANFRPEYEADWLDAAHVRRLELTPLGAEALDELLADLLGSDPSLDGLAELIRERTGGNPFYVEETVRDLAESGALEGDRGSYRLVEEIDEIKVPATVQAILAARIDRLDADAKATLQVGATIGQEFGRGLLASAGELEDEALDAALRGLSEAEFVYETASFPEPEYAFAHPLTREVAYGSQLASSRARTHAAIAHGLQEADPESLDERAGLIAQHFDEAGEAMDAAGWHARAAGWAGFNDPAGALRHWRRVRELDPELPEGADADGLRLAGRTMTLAFGWRLGIDVAEAREVFEEGKAIAERLGDDVALALLYAGMGLTAGTCAGDTQGYLRYSEESMRIVSKSTDPGVQAALSIQTYYPHFLLGHYEEALAVLDRCLELTRDDPMLGGGVVVASPRGFAISFRAGTLASLGRFEEARQAVTDGIEFCRRYDRETLGWTHTFPCWMALRGGLPAEEGLRHGRQAVEIATELGDAFSNIVTRVWLGLAQLTVGQPDAALESFDIVLELIAGRAAGVEFEPLCRVGRAGALRATGRLDEALTEVELAERLARERTIAWTLPFGLQTRAEILLDLDGAGAADGVTAALDEADEIARGNGQLPDLAAILEIRARLAGLEGDDAARQRDLEEALDRAREMGADQQVERLEGQLKSAV